MIKQFLTVSGCALMFITSCQEASEQKSIASDSMAVQQPVTENGNTNTPNSATKYVDLKTGQPVDLYYNSKKRRTYSATNNEPVDYYVNTTTGDTVYGRGRYVVNNYIVKTSDGTYKLDDRKLKVSNEELKLKDGDQKLKVEEDEMKMKDEDMKYKADDGDEKMKSEKKKVKTESDDK
jgi:hypothetical protein